MPDTTFPDEWLATSLEGVITPELLEELRAKAEPNRTLWEMIVSRHIATDEGILEKLATRYRLKVADVTLVDPKVKDTLPEQLVRRYRVLPVRITDSYCEVATANPFDLDAEKSLAFATGREVRMLLLPPAKIAEKLDELYRPDKTLDRLLENMEDSSDLIHLAEEAPDELGASEEEASQRPVVKLVDPAAHQLFVLDQRQVGLDARGVAVHHEPDGARGRDHRHLRVATSAEGWPRSMNGHAELQVEAHRCGKVVHQPGDGRAFFRHGDVNLARRAVLVPGNGDVGAPQAARRATPHHPQVFHRGHEGQALDGQLARSARSHSVIMRVVRKRILLQVLRGTADANIRFDDLRSLLTALGFVERVKDSHHVFAKPDVVCDRPT